MPISRRHLFRTTLAAVTATAAAPIIPPVRRVSRPFPVHETTSARPGEYRFVMEFDNAPDIIVADPIKTVRRWYDEVNERVHLGIDPIVVDCHTLPLTEAHQTVTSLRVDASWLGPDTWVKIVKWDKMPVPINPHGSVTLKVDGDIIII